MTLTVPWLPVSHDLIAKKWQLTEVKYHFDIILGKMLENEPTLDMDIEVPYLKAVNVQWNGVILDDLPKMWCSTSELEILSVKKGDLLVCEGGEVGRAAIVKDLPPDNCIVQNALHIVRPKATGDIRYLRYLLIQAASKGWLDVLCNRATIAHFTVEKFKEMPIWLPPLSEQRAIADFLDRQTEKIDALIAKKQHLLDLLAERRLALITYAVTKGLNPSVQMKDSGVEWLGKIPIDWNIDYARWLFDEIDDRSMTGDEELMSVSHITGVTPRAEKDVNMFMAETLEGYKVCQYGDLVINTLWAWMGAMGVIFQDGIVSPSYNVYRPTGQYELGYLDYLVRLPIFAQEVTRYSKGVWSSRLRLYPEEFFTVVLPVPPLDVQKQIVDMLNIEIGRLDKLKEKIEKIIERLHERRAALINEAVTGKIRVTE